VELLQDKLEIFNPDGTPRSIEDAPLNRSLKGETVRGEELARHVRTRQLMHREYISSPIHSNSGLIIGAVAVVRDITEQKRIERELQFAMINLEQTNSELRDFAFIASHDLQEPLRKVTTFSREIIDHHAMSLDETGRDYLHRMADAARRMQEMLVSLLDYSRINTQGVPFVRVNLNEVVQGVLSDLEVRIAQVHAEVAVEALPEIDADPMQMRQLMQNLLSNALKYYPEGQSPTIRVWYETLQDTDQVRLFIQDNGIGFEEEYRDLIFQPFRRLHGRSAYEGTGMGLAICRKIVDRHHGAITASSALGQGATFMVILPRRQYSGSA
jgi:light-regulated signal transduction histidine kinase (bacteriophytochrome)